MPGRRQDTLRDEVKHGNVVKVPMQRVNNRQRNDRNSDAAQTIMDVGRPPS